MLSVDRVEENSMSTTVVFRTTLKKGGAILKTLSSDRLGFIPGFGQNVIVGGTEYQTVNMFWRLDGEPLGVEDDLIFPPYIEVVLDS